MKEWDNEVHELALQRRANKRLEEAKRRLEEEDTLALSAEEYELISGDNKERGE